MARRTAESLLAAVGCAGLLLVAGSGCKSTGDWARIVQQNESLQRDVNRLERAAKNRDEAIAKLSEQVRTLESFGSDRPADLFAPVMLEIVSRSGGRDYNGEPGDDGVTVYLRPRDADGDPVKAPGRITIQLLDNTDLNAPYVLAVCEFSDAEVLRRSWYSRFATNHYTLPCPFPPELQHPVPSRVTVSAAFVDYLTGATLTAVSEVSVSRPES